MTGRMRVRLSVDWLLFSALLNWHTNARNHGKHFNDYWQPYSGPEGSHMQIKNSTCKLKIVHAN